MTTPNKPVNGYGWGMKPAEILERLRQRAADPSQPASERKAAERMLRAAEMEAKRKGGYDDE